ncbi:MAG: CpaE-like family protein [Sporichthyaceae bacterium]|nr:CpaE-like family protein [Sporichthyaceae bacterium]
MLTADSELLDEVLRVSAAASVPVEVAPDPGAARRAWADAPLVLVGDDATAEVASRTLPRRSGVVLVGRNPGDPDIWQRGVRVGAEDVVFVPDGDEWLANRLADAAEGDLRLASVLCVIGGRGGAGASTLAAALAVTAVRAGLGCLLVDADPLGGGLDLVLGYEGADGLRWPQLVEARGRISSAALHEALPAGSGVAASGAGRQRLPLVSCDRAEPVELPAEGMAAVLDAGRRGADLVVVDLARHRTPAGDVALGRATATLLVIPAEVRAAAAAGQVAQWVGAATTDIRLVVRGPGPTGLRADTIAASLGLPLAGEMRADPDVGAALDRGIAPARSGRGPLAALCQQLIPALVSRSAVVGRPDRMP